ncbi:MAG: 50S ribosomal protein L32 [Deltaproteobacteria bacterium]|nr:MAG: 50S ribosomal protein L32 [Deltaproteobacteria bacterium]
MAVPKRRHSVTRRNKRRANDGLTSPNLDSCPECGEAKLPHRACPSCGSYKGRVVVAQPEEVEE